MKTVRRSDAIDVRVVSCAATGKLNLHGSSFQGDGPPVIHLEVIDDVRWLLEVRWLGSVNEQEANNALRRGDRVQHVCFLGRVPAIPERRRRQRRRLVSIDSARPFMQPVVDVATQTRDVATIEYPAGGISRQETLCSGLIQAKTVETLVPRIQLDPKGGPRLKSESSEEEVPTATSYVEENCSRDA